MRTDELTDRQINRFTYKTKHILAFLNSANAAKNVEYILYFCDR